MYGTGINAHRMYCKQKVLSVLIYMFLPYGTAVDSPSMAQRRLVWTSCSNIPDYRKNTKYFHACKHILCSIYTGSTHDSRINITSQFKRTGIFCFSLLVSQNLIGSYRTIFPYLVQYISLYVKVFLRYHLPKVNWTNTCKTFMDVDGITHNHKFISRPLKHVST